MLVRALSVLALVLAPVVSYAADDENPYKNVKVGDYASYKMTTKFGAITATGTVVQAITAKSDKEVTVEARITIEVAGNKMELPAQEQKIDLTKPFDPTKAGNLPAGAEVKVEKLKDGKEKIKVGGKEYDATWTTYKTKAKVAGQEIDSEMKVWMAKDVPGGIVKMTTNGKVAGQDTEMVMELTETGNKKKE